jgi:hypothetical protein
MEQILVNGANQVFAAIPSGVAIKNVAGAANVVLSPSEAAADIIEFTGVLTGNIIVTVPQTLQSPQVVGTPSTFPAPPPPIGPGNSLLVASWQKFFVNNTTGAFTITIQGQSLVSGGPPPTNVLVLASPGPKTQFAHSADGINVFASGAAV